MQQLLLSLKTEHGDAEQFLRLWEQVIAEPVPEWLLESSEERDATSLRIAPEQMRVIQANTVAALTTMPEKREEWRKVLQDAWHEVEQNQRADEAEFLMALLALLDGKSASLPADHPYTEALTHIQEDVAAGGSSQTASEATLSDEVIQAVQDFVSAENWEATRAVVERRQALLSLPEVETLFEQNIAYARATGDEHAVRLLELHLALLRACKRDGIAAAFANLETSDEEALPFDPDLITRSIAALLGGPQEKLQHMQYLATAATNTTDDGVKALIATIQLALFSEHLAQLGRDLTGIYRQAWETITASVEAGGVDPRLFEALIQNTVAVLSPAAQQRNEWRTTLAGWHNQATAEGDRNLSALLDAVIGLLDADGNPTGLGTSLQGIYARTWQAIVEHLPQ